MQRPIYLVAVVVAVPAILHVSWAKYFPQQCLYEACSCLLNDTAGQMAMVGIFRPERIGLLGGLHAHACISECQNSWTSPAWDSTRRLSDVGGECAVTEIKGNLLELLVAWLMDAAHHPKASGYP